ncbi:MAG: PD-(D/E)XK motif protein [Candidatus Nanopelagicaceae bacterium]
MKLRDVLADLASEAAIEPTDFVCRPIPNSAMLLGRDGRNNLILLSEKSEPRVDLHAGSFHYSSVISVRWFDKISHESQMSLLRTSSCGPQEEEAFLRIVESILLTSQANREHEICRELVQAWFSLLISKNEVSHESIIGLFGELLVILNSVDSELAISRWQWRNSELLDFAWMDLALEVKTSSTGQRHHQTSLFQNRAAMGKSTVLASLLVDESFEGDNIFDIQLKIQSRLPKDSPMRLELAAAIIRRVGISDLVFETRIDLDSANRSLNLVRWKDLPDPIFPSAILEADWTFNVPVEKARSLGGRTIDDVFLRKLFAI